MGQRHGRLRRKRGIAVNVPEWQIGNCIQCNRCAYVCPHAAIRPFLVTEAEAEASGAAWKQGLGETKEYKFRIQVTPLDCTGCGNLRGRVSGQGEGARHEAARKPDGGVRALELPERPHRLQAGGGQDQEREEPPSSHSRCSSSPGACAGCGETPYIKAISQLFGDRMMVANAARLHLDLLGFGTLDALLHRRFGRGWSGMGQLALRGQRRVRSGHAQAWKLRDGIQENHGGGDRRVREVLPTS